MCRPVNSPYVDKSRQTSKSHPVPGRQTMAGAYLDKTDLYTIQELCLRLSRERGHRMHFQEFAVAAYTHECARYGVELSGKSN